MMIEKITTRQMMLFMIATRISIAISVMPATNLPPHNQDIWIMVLLSIVYTLIFGIPLVYLANKFTDDSTIGYTKKIFGEPLGKIIGMFYAMFFILTSIDEITIQSELVATNFLVDTSNIVIIGIMIISCIYLVTKGIRIILISSEFLVPIAFVIIILLIIIGIFKMDYSIILPVLKYSSFQDMNMGAIQVASFYTDIFLLTMIAPELKNKKDINKIFIVTIILSITFLAIAIVIVFGTIGIEQAKHSNFPFILFTRALKNMRILERIDPIFIIAWLITDIFRIVGFLYISIKAIREVFNKDEKENTIGFIVGGISGLVSIFILNQRSVIGVRKEFILFYEILFVIFILIIPIATCIVYFFRRKTFEDM